MDQFYFEEGYIADGYFSIVREASASLTASASMSCAGDIAPTTGYFIPDYIADDYFVAGGVVQEASAALSVSATTSVTANRIRSGSASIDGVLTFSAVASARRTTEIVLDTSVNLSATSAKTAVTSVTLTNIVNLNIQAAKTTGFNTALAASFGLTTTATKLKLVNATLNSTATVEITAQVANRRPRVPEIIGTPTINTANKQFGTGSLSQGNGNYLEYYPSPDYKTTKTVDFWYKPISFSVNGYENPIYTHEAADSQRWNVGITRVSGGFELRIRTRISDTNYSYFSDTYSLSGFTHFRIQRDTDGVYVWVNGVLDTPRINETIGSYPNINDGITIGGDGTLSYLGTGYIDELFITSDLLVDKTTSSFTVPSTPYTLSTAQQNNTILLAHFDDFTDDVSEYFFGESSLSATASATIDPTKLVTASSNFNVAASLAADVSEIEQANINLSAASTLTVDAVKTTSTVVDIAGAAQFNVSVDLINPGDALLLASAALSASPVKQIGGVINTGAAAILNADIVRVKGLAGTTISTAATLTSTVDVQLGLANTTLSTVASLTSTINFKHLQLRQGGYINTITTDVSNNLDNVTHTDGYPGFDKDAYLANFWLKLSRNLNNGESITLWRSSTSTTNPSDTLVSRLNLSRTTSGNYRFTFTRYLDYANTNVTPTDYATNFYQIETVSRTVVDNTTDFTEWHNVSIPWGTRNSTPGTGFDGSANNFTPSSSTSTLRSKDGGTPFFRLNAGVWGHPDNTDVDISINKLWIGNVESSPEANIEADAFYNFNNDWEVSYGVNGTIDFTYGNEDQFNASVTPSIFFDWEQGLGEDSSNQINPEWNYAANGNVQTGFLFEFDSSLDSSAILYVDETWLLLGKANVNVTASQDVLATRIFQLDASAEIASTMSTNAEKIAGGNLDIATQFTQDATAVKTSRITQELSTVATVDASVRRIRNNTIDKDVTATIDTTAARLRDPGNVTPNLSATLECIAVKTAQANVDIDGVLSFNATARAKRTAETQLDSTATLVTSPVKKTGTLAILDASATLAATAFNTVSFDIDISTNTTLVADVEKVISGDASLNLSASIDEVTVAQFKGFELVTNADFAIATTATRIQQNDSGLNTVARITISGDRIRLSQADMAAQFDPFYANAFRVVSAEVELDAFVVTVTAGDIIAIDPFRTLLITEESRQLKILEEDRDLTIDEETRVLVL